jgi:hypothetical protein
LANELKHASQGTELSQAEFEAVGLHVFNSQATGDIVYASSSTQLSRLGKGADNTFFQMGGSNIPEWVQDVTFQGASGSAMIQYWFGDAGEDNADKWRVSVADGGTLTYDSYISGSYVTHMTVAPNSTVASSTTTIHGTLTMGSTATLTNAGLVAVADQSNITGLGTISSGTWQGTAIAHGYIADDIVSGQAEITTGLVSADEMMYSDGGVIKRIGIDVLATKLFSVASAGTVAQASDHMLFLDNGATGDVIVESIDDFLSAIAGSGISVSSSQLTASGGVSVGKAIAFSIVF